MRIIEKQFFIAGCVALLAAVIGFLVLQYAYQMPDQKPFPLLQLVFLAGCVGGTTNHYRRLKALPTNDEELSRLATTPSFLLQAVVSPILGGIFAVLAYLIFAGAILQGPLFPTFKAVEDDYKTLNGFFNITPKTNGDVAKMIVWAFLAGFSERFVPNLLDRLSRDADD